MAGKGTAKLAGNRLPQNNQPMRVQRYTSAARFRDATRSFLARNEAHNNLLLGVSAGLGDQGSSAQAAYMAVVEDADAAPIAVALMTPPWNLLLSWPFPDAAVDLVADDLLAGDGQPPGVLGLSPVAELFARAWQERTDAEPRLELAQRIYQLERVEPVVGVPGRLVRADDRHRSLVIDWMAGFDRDVGMTPPVSPAERVGSFLHGPDRELYLWFENGPVSMAASSGPTPLPTFHETGCRLSTRQVADFPREMNTIHYLGARAPSPVAADRVRSPAPRSRTSRARPVSTVWAAGTPIRGDPVHESWKILPLTARSFVAELQRPPLARKAAASVSVRNIVPPSPLVA
jgi:hypothetical protein